MERNYIVPSDAAGVRADKMLARAFPEFSRTALQRAFDAGLVKSGNRSVKRGHPVSSGEELAFSLPEILPAGIRPVAIPLKVLREDSHLLAVDKQPGMVVHPGAGTRDDTLVHALLAHCKGKLSGVGGVERPGIVHRLDRETSGVILVAKNDRAHRGLSEQFSSRMVVKEYLALVSGVPELLSGTVNRPIGRNATQRHKMAVVDGEPRGRDAVTDWEVVERFGSLAALVRCTLHTGRTHQIRVHMKFLGHPLLGDAIYGWKPVAGMSRTPGRIMLHAEHLALRHPITSRKLDLKAPLPDDFRAMIRSLRDDLSRLRKASSRVRRAKA